MKKNILKALCLLFLLACKKEKNVIKIPQGTLVVEEMWSKKEPDTLRNIMPYIFQAGEHTWEETKKEYVAVADTAYYDLPPVYGGELDEDSNKKRSCNTKTKRYYMDKLSNPLTKRSVYDASGKYATSSFAEVEQYEFLYSFSTNLLLDTITKDSFLEVRLIIKDSVNGQWYDMEKQNFDHSSIIVKKANLDLINIYGSRWPATSELIFKKKMKDIFFFDRNTKYKDLSGIWAQPKFRSIGMGKNRRRIELVYQRKIDQKKITIVKEVENTGGFCFPYDPKNEEENQKYQIFKEGHPDYWDYWNGKINKNHPVYGKYWFPLELSDYHPNNHQNTIIEE